MPSTELKRFLPYVAEQAEDPHSLTNEELLKNWEGIREFYEEIDKKVDAILEAVAAIGGLSKRLGELSGLALNWRQEYDKTKAYLLKGATECELEAWKLLCRLNDELTAVEDYMFVFGTFGNERAAALEEAASTRHGVDLQPLPMAEVDDEPSFDVGAFLSVPDNSFHSGRAQLLGRLEKRVALSKNSGIRDIPLETRIVVSFKKAGQKGNLRLARILKDGAKINSENKSGKYADYPHGNPVKWYEARDKDNKEGKLFAKHLSRLRQEAIDQGWWEKIPADYYTGYERRGR